MMYLVKWFNKIRQKAGVKITKSVLTRALKKATDEQVIKVYIRMDQVQRKKTGIMNISAYCQRGDCLHCNTELIKCEDICHKV